MTHALDHVALTDDDSIPGSAWLPYLLSHDLSVAMNVIAMSIRKGGAGKTTYLLLLADVLTRFGLNVCVVDSDSQANSSSAFGRKVHLVPAGMDKFGRTLEEPNYITLTDVIDNGSPGIITQAMLDVGWNEWRDPSAPWTHGGPLRGNFGALRLVPCFNTLEDAATKWTPADFTRLASTLRHSDPDGYAVEGVQVPPSALFDVVLIDTPPGGTNVHRQALKAADWALMVTNAERFGVEAVPETYNQIQDVRTNFLHPDLQILGLVLNEYQPHRKLVAGMTRDLENDLVTEDVDNSALAEIQTERLNIRLFDDRLPVRSVIADAQAADAPLSAYLADPRQRKPATEVCKTVERVAVKLLHQINHPLASLIETQLEQAWPNKEVPAK